MVYMVWHKFGGTMSNMHGTGGKRFFQAELRPPKVDPSFKNFQPKVTVVDSALGDWMYTLDCYDY